MLQHGPDELATVRATCGTVDLRHGRSGAARSRSGRSAFSRTSCDRRRGDDSAAVPRGVASAVAALVVSRALPLPGTTLSTNASSASPQQGGDIDGSTAQHRSKQASAPSPDRPATLAAIDRAPSGGSTCTESCPAHRPSRSMVTSISATAIEAAGPRTWGRRSCRSWSVTITAVPSSYSATSSRAMSRCRCPSRTRTRPTTGGSRSGAPPTWVATPTCRASSGSTMVVCPTPATTSPGVPTVATGSSCSPTGGASRSHR